MDSLPYVAVLVVLLLVPVGIVVRLDRRRRRSRGAAEATHEWQRDQRRVGDDAQWITDDGR